MGLKEDIKAIIVKSGWTLTDVAKELNNRHKTDYTIQNFINKINRESLKYDEVLEIADIIGYRIEWIPK